MIVDWRKSSRSGGVDDKYCVEVAQLPAPTTPATAGRAA